MSDPGCQLLDANVRWFRILVHPGHELRAYHFLERVCPFVAVMTDGSGSNGTPRVDDSAFRRKLEAVASCDALKADAEAASRTTDKMPSGWSSCVACPRTRRPLWHPGFRSTNRCEARVQEGRYGSVLRYQAHVKPVIDRLMMLSPVSHADDLYTLHE